MELEGVQRALHVCVWINNYNIYLFNCLRVSEMPISVVMLIVIFFINVKINSSETESKLTPVSFAFQLFLIVTIQTAKSMAPTAPCQPT